MGQPFKRFSSTDSSVVAQQTSIATHDYREVTVIMNYYVTTVLHKYHLRPH